MEHADEICPFVQILHAPVLPMEEQLANFFSSLDTQSPVEQVIDVLKITQDRIQQRLVDRDLRRTQMADQLVEVSTSLFLSLLQQQRAEQIVDNPVPRGRGAVAEVFKEDPQDRGQHRRLSRSLTFQFLAVVFKVFARNRVFPLHLQFLALRMGRFKGLFRTLDRRSRRLLGQVVHRPGEVGPALRR